jgi:2-desacetyl-2-hydroxyethyl bacteriochlorophyllide A dehydrogenase
MRMMKAAMTRKKDAGASIQVEEVKKPIPAQGEALVKVHYAGICGTDMHIITGHYTKANLPLIIGHEFVGEIAEINSPIPTGYEVGEKVVVHPIRTCGVCDACLRGLENVCESLSIIGVHEDGGYAEYVTVPVSKLLKLPDDIDMKQAGMLEPLAIAVHDVRKSGITIGENAIVIGGGPIGILMALIIKLSGADVIVSEINDFRVGFIRNLGIRVVNPKETDVVEEVMKMTNGRGVDVTFEVSGANAGVELMTKVTKRGGVIVNTGVPSDMTPINLSEVFMKELRIQGVRLHSRNDFEIAIKIIASSAIKKELDQFITRVFDIDDVEDAMKYAVEDQEHFKVLIKVIGE